MTDPIADFLTRIRNAITARKAKLELPTSRMKKRLAEVLRDEGFLLSVAERKEVPQGTLEIELRWASPRANAIQGLRRVSKPGQRKYVGHDEIPRVRSGLGVSVLSTSKGVMIDRDARKAGLGGELICEIW